MELSDTDRRLLAALSQGLPLAPRPYGVLGRHLGLAESEVLSRLRRLADGGTFNRFGVIVQHRALGYRANAMVAWDVPDDRVRETGRTLAGLPFVSLCYRRRRRPPSWPYNLFCMIHGRERATVQAQIDVATRAAGLQAAPRAVLFSRRRFKQRGARYQAAGAPAGAV